MRASLVSAEVAGGEQHPLEPAADVATASGAAGVVALEAEAREGHPPAVAHAAEAELVGHAARR